MYVINSCTYPYIQKKKKKGENPNSVGSREEKKPLEWVVIYLGTVCGRSHMIS